MTSCLFLNVKKEHPPGVYVPHLALSLVEGKESHCFCLKTFNLLLSFGSLVRNISIYLVFVDRIDNLSRGSLIATRGTELSILSTKSSSIRFLAHLCMPALE